MHCPKCGVAIADNAVFCNKCGAAVPEGAKAMHTPSAARINSIQLLTQRLASLFAEGGKPRKALSVVTFACVALTVITAGAFMYLWIGDRAMPGKLAAAEENVAQLQAELDDLNGQIDQSKRTVSQLNAQQKTVEDAIDADTGLLDSINRADDAAASAGDRISELELSLAKRYSNAQVELLCYLNDYNNERASITADVQTVEDVFTDYVLGELSNSDTVQASIKSAIGGITSGDSLDAVGRDAIAAALNELPNEVRGNVVDKFVDTTLIKNVNKVTQLLQRAPSRPQALINQLSAQSDEYLVSITRFLEAEQSLESFKACVEDVERMYSLMEELQKAVPDADLQLESWKMCSWDMGAFFTGYIDEYQMLEMLKEGANVDAEQ